MNWTASVNSGPDREAKPLLTTIRVYHGFKAEDIIVNENPPPPHNIIPYGNSINLKVNTTPFLAYQDRIIYHWEDTPQDIGNFDENHTPFAKEVGFTTINTGDVEIRYYIEDNVTGYTSELSAPLTVHSASITVVPPLDDRFTFSPASTGILDGDFHVDIEPPSIRELVTWSFDPIGSSILTITPDLPNGDVHFEYENLPIDNDFGVKKVKASMPNPDVSDSIKIRAYFPKNTTNNPSQINPNWYYYWSKTTANTGTHTYGGQYCQGTIQGYYWDGDNYFHVCPPAGQSWLCECHSRTFEGIDNFAVTCLHENQHQTDWFAWWFPLGGYNVIYDSGDRDYVPDIIEPLYGFDPTQWDTDRDGWKDWEDRGYDAECPWVESFADKHDWANPGHQY